MVDDVICGSDAGAPPYLSRHRHWNSVTTNSGANDDAETTERAQLSKATPVRRLSSKRVSTTTPDLPRAARKS